MFPRRIVRVLLALFLLVSFSAHIAYGDELDTQLNETQQKLNAALSEKNKTQQELNRLEKLKQQYSGSLRSLQQSISITNQQITLTEQSMTSKEQELNQVMDDLKKTEDTLNHRKERLKETIRTFYIMGKPNKFESLINPMQGSVTTQSFVYRMNIIASNRDQIIDLNSDLTKISELKSALVQLKDQLQQEKTELEQKKKDLEKSIQSTQSSLASTSSKAQNMQQSLLGLEGQISSLTQKQRDILAAKAAAALASTTVGNTEINKAAIEKSPPKDGAVYFSFWTYGYPHRVGLSQYGALGRAWAGQSVDQILKAYYQGVELVSWNAPSQITINHNGTTQTIPFEEDYLMGIGEMPSCWGDSSHKGMEALKAQAIIARTYALNYTNNGAKPICTTQSCQVYIGASKVNGACGNYWKQAVEETRGKVLVSGGQLITAAYASTSGGFTLNSEDAKPHFSAYRSYLRGIADFAPDGKPYEGPDYGGSPWYHKAWGNEPWLSINQVTDLFNAALLPESYDNQLNTLSGDQVVTQLNNSAITPVSGLKALEIIDQNGNKGANTAQVAKVRAYFGDGQMAEVTGARFKFVYNLRSPGTNAIWTTRFDIVTAAEL